jgi:hypothetical protein
MRCGPEFQTAASTTLCTACVQQQTRIARPRPTTAASLHVPSHAIIFRNPVPPREKLGPGTGAVPQLPGLEAKGQHEKSLRASHPAWAVCSVESSPGDQPGCGLRLAAHPNPVRAASQDLFTVNPSFFNRPFLTAKLASRSPSCCSSPLSTSRTATAFA